MNASIKLGKIEQLRARDGDSCWLCGGALDFRAVPNSKKAPTKEHLVAQCHGGTDALDNLVLCHPGCNKHLGVRPKADKLKMRAQQKANRDKQAEAREKSQATVANRATSAMRGAAMPRPAPIDWRRVAMIATASAIFLAGLSLGLLIG